MLKHIARIWKRPVHLLTFDEGQGRRLTSDGNEVQIIETKAADEHCYGRASLEGRLIASREVAANRASRDRHAGTPDERASGSALLRAPTPCVPPPSTPDRRRLGRNAEQARREELEGTRHGPDLARNTDVAGRRDVTCESPSRGACRHRLRQLPAESVQGEQVARRCPVGTSEEFHATLGLEARSELPRRRFARAVGREDERRTRSRARSTVATGLRVRYRGGAHRRDVDLVVVDTRVGGRCTRPDCRRG